MKRFTATVILVALLAALVPSAQAAQPECVFSDVSQGAWYYDAVQYVYENGMFSGVGNDRFDPDGTMTRAMLVTVLWRCAGEETVTGETFADVNPNRYYAQAVTWASANGYVLGTGHNRFQPDAPVTREETATILYRYMLKNGEEMTGDDFLSAFADSGAISRWAREQLRWAVQTGIIRGSAEPDGTRLQPQAKATRAQLAAILMRLFTRRTDALSQQEITYGNSGSGAYPLTAVKLGDGKNVLILTYALHGWEDNFARDGGELIYLADCVRQMLLRNASLLQSYDWTVYLIRCANPDGYYDGYTYNGPGRCTTTRLDEAGTLFTDGIGVDINRCFPYRYKPLTEPRYFNGSAPLQCVEAQALASFVQSVRGSANNVLIDTHGWYNQTITSSGMNAIYKAFSAQFPTSTYTPLANAIGYFSAWAAFCENFDACLFELPGDVYSHEGFVASGYVERYETALAQLLMSYYHSENLTSKLNLDKTTE